MKRQFEDKIYSLVQKGAQHDRSTGASWAVRDENRSVRGHDFRVHAFVNSPVQLYIEPCLPPFKP